MQKRQSAGGVLYKHKESELYIYLVEHSEYGYVLPKGTRKPDESWEENAQREIEEETGFKVDKPDHELGLLSFTFEKDGQKIDKEVMFFAFEINGQIPSDMNLDEGEKLMGGKWFPLMEAVSIDPHPSEREMILKLKNLL